MGYPPYETCIIQHALYIIDHGLSFSLQCFDTVGWAKEGHPACKKLGVGLSVMTFWLELCTSYSSSCYHHFHHISSNKIQNRDILVPANPGPPGKWPLKWRERLWAFFHSSGQTWVSSVQHPHRHVTEVIPETSVSVNHLHWACFHVLFNNKRQQCTT